MTRRLRILQTVDSPARRAVCETADRASRRILQTVKLPRCTDAVLNAITAPYLSAQGFLWTGEQQAEVLDNWERMQALLAKQTQADQLEVLRIAGEMRNTGFAIGRVLTPETASKVDAGQIWAGFADLTSRMTKALQKVLDGTLTPGESERANAIRQIAERIHPDTGRVLGIDDPRPARVVDNGSKPVKISDLQAAIDAHNRKEVRRSMTGDQLKVVDAQEEARQSVSDFAKRANERAAAWYQRLGRR